LAKYKSVAIWQKRVARIVAGDNGRFYYVSDRTEERSELDYATRSAAMRAAAHAGFTHVCGLTTWPDGRVKRIPPYLRDVP